MRRPFLEFPLLRRELIALLRTRRAFWLLFLVAVLSSLGLWLFWGEFEKYGRISQRRFSGSMIEAFFAGFSSCQLVVSLLLVPAFAATSICREREAKTADMLYTTLLSPASIIFSKWLSSVGYIVIVLVTCSPIISTLYLLGGISFVGVLKAYTLTLAAVATAGLICLAASIRSDQTARAVVRGVVAILFWNGVLGAAISAFVGLLGRYWAPSELTYTVEGLAMLMAPFVPLLDATTTSLVGTLPNAPPLPPFSGYLAYMGLVGALHLLYLLRRVRTPESIARTRDRKKPRSRAPRRTLLSGVLADAFDHGKRVPLNPLLAREIRHDVLSSLWIRRALFWLLLAIFCGFAFFNAGLEIRLGVPTLASVLFFTVLLPSIPATSLPREVERGTFDAIQTTLLSPRQIVLAKFLAGLHGGSGVLAAVFVAVAGVAVVRALGEASSFAWSAFFTALAVPTFSLLFYTAVATLASVLAKRSLSALLITYGTVFSLLLGIPFVLALLDGFGVFHWSLAQSIIDATNAFNAAVNGLDWFSSQVSVGFVLFHGLGAVLVLLLAIAIFDRRCNVHRRHHGPTGPAVRSIENASSGRGTEHFPQT